MTRPLDLVLSDIHADLDGLDTILAAVSSPGFEARYGRFSRVLCLGDVLERGTRPAEVLARLRELSARYPVESVMGNHDESFFYGYHMSGSTGESVRAHDRLTADDLAFFTGNGDGTFGRQQFVDGELGLVCVHGGPLDPAAITPKNPEDPWLYQRTWQRLSMEGEYFSRLGYHYAPPSAFAEAARYVREPLILCGHQHAEAAVESLDGHTRDVLPSANTKTAIDGLILGEREIVLKPGAGYIIRVGIAGPQGSYGGPAVPHFALVDHAVRTVRLFSVAAGTGPSS